MKNDDFEVVALPRDTARKQKQNSDAHDLSLDWEAYASKYLEFTDNNPTSLHAVAFLRAEFERHGFTYLNERDDWSEALEKGTRFVTTRNGTAFLAFVKGKGWKPSDGASITGTHTDSLHAVLKPTSVRTNIDGFELLGVAPYSGALSSAWWDRDLGIGGRIVVKDGNAIKTKLVRVPYPVARIPSLAPHFGTPANGPFNLETQAVPVIGLVPVEGLPEPSAEEKKSPVVGKHPLRLLRVIAKYAEVELKDILDIELSLYDTQPASFGGLEKEFLFAPRIDDKICTYVASYGLLESADTVEKNGGFAIVAGYDNEELGSLSRQGARGNLLESVIDRVLGDVPQSTERLFYANSFLASADVTHAVNPNFTDIYLAGHKPKLNTGLTLSYDSNGAMITNSVSASLAHEIARQSGNTLQQFHIRNDSRSGGTIGPFLSSKTGLRGVDIGIAQLSMHSIRATVGSKDIYLGVRYFKAYNELYHSVDTLFKLGDLQT